MLARRVCLYRRENFIKLFFACPAPHDFIHAFKVFGLRKCLLEFDRVCLLDMNVVSFQLRDTKFGEAPVVVKVSCLPWQSGLSVDSLSWDDGAPNEDRME